MLWGPWQGHRERVLVCWWGGWDGGSWGFDFVMHCLSTFSMSDRGEGCWLLQGESIMTHEQARNLGRRQVDGGSVPLLSESSWACVLGWVMPRGWTACWTGEGGGDAVIVICEVYVTAISLGCQYNAPDIKFYVWWYLQLSQVDICCRGATFYLSLISSSAGMLHTLFSTLNIVLFPPLQSPWVSVTQGSLLSHIIRDAAHVVECQWISWLFAFCWTGKGGSGMVWVAEHWLMCWLRVAWQTGKGGSETEPVAEHRMICWACVALLWKRILLAALLSLNLGSCCWQWLFCLREQGLSPSTWLRTEN